MKQLKFACARRFVIGRERPGQQSEVATLIQQTLEQERRQRELLEQQYAHYDADDDEVMTIHNPKPQYGMPPFKYFHTLYLHFFEIPLLTIYTLVTHDTVLGKLSLECLGNVNQLPSRDICHEVLSY